MSTDEGRRLVATMACAVVFAIVLPGIAAGAVMCAERAVTTDGIGSSLQLVAQREVWRPARAELCTTQTVTYEARGSGEGLRAWGAEAFRRREFVAESGWEFIATDIPLERGQLRNIKENANGVEPTVVPMAQAAIAVIVNPPRECTITSIRNRPLERVFRGERENINWESIGTGAGCRGVRIQRVVRRDASGTTYQFKHYLWLINRVAIGARDWLQYKEARENTAWPAGEGLAVRAAAANGGASLVTAVRETANSIGYVNLADAAGRVTVLRVENESGTPVEPRTSGNANCASTVYKRNLGREGELGRPRQETDWTEVYGSDPTIGTTRASAYSICTLTWDVGILEYTTARFTIMVGIAVEGYFGQIVEALAQEALSGRNYATLPATIREGAVQIAQAMNEGNRVLTQSPSLITIEAGVEEVEVTLRNDSPVTSEIENGGISGGESLVVITEGTCRRGVILRRGESCRYTIRRREARSRGHIIITYLACGWWGWYAYNAWVWT